eukprot:CAMPEP_0171851980 /NCGR_PEP_ID=MMETSP0992-20121227/21342_1 /TAXON_ID=483369 /ORGANISM="non described non described, Strain CCMP2098" /LENGTH=47 /DNA_ID= /DNA_START= /DNA_END= /DNA_ORIENTATION=
MGSSADRVCFSQLFKLRLPHLPHLFMFTTSVIPHAARFAATTLPRLL